MPQRSIRFPDELHDAIEAEAARLDRSFSWVVTNACEQALAAAPLDETPRPSPAGREAKTEVALRAARSPATARQSASRSAVSPRASATATQLGKGFTPPIPKTKGKR